MMVEKSFTYLSVGLKAIFWETYLFRKMIIANRELKTKIKANNPIPKG